MTAEPDPTPGAAVGLNWREVSVDEIKSAEPSAIAIGPFGSRMKRDLYVEHGIPVIRGMNIDDGRRLVGDFVHVAPETANGLRSSNVFHNDLVFPHRGAIGSVGIVPPDGPERWMLSTSLMKLTCDPQVADALFVFYFFRSPNGQAELLKHSSNVGTPGIAQPLTSLRSIKLRLPPLRTQHQIATLLSTLDDLIENNRRRIEVLEEMAQAIYREWFIHFRYPGHEDATLVNSALGQIPEGWEVVPASAALTINPRVKSSKDIEDPFITMRDLSESGMICFPSERKQGSSGSKFQNGDTVFARITPCLENGKTGLVNTLEDGQAARGSTEFVVLRGAMVGKAFTYLLARDPDFRAHAVASMVGASGRQRIRNECFNTFLLSVPPSGILARFEQLVDGHISLAYSLARSSRHLAKIRDLLLPKLVSGEIDVSALDLDALVETM